jgi:hypothetical protein
MEVVEVMPAVEAMVVVEVMEDLMWMSMLEANQDTTAMLMSMLTNQTRGKIFHVHLTYS